MIKITSSEIDLSILVPEKLARKYNLFPMELNEDSLIIGIEEENIYNITNKLLNDKNEYDRMAKAVNPYGDGKACIRIVDSIIDYFNK